MHLGFSKYGKNLVCGFIKVCIRSWDKGIHRPCDNTLMLEEFPCTKLTNDNIQYAFIAATATAVEGLMGMQAAALQH